MTPDATLPLHNQQHDADAARGTRVVAAGWEARLVRLAKRTWSLWMALFFWGYILVLFPLYALFLNIRRTWAHNAAHALNIGWGHVLLAMGGIVVRVRFEAPVPQGVPYVFVSNHSSYLDIPICHVALPRMFRFMAKSDLARVPLFGYMYRRLQVMVNRDNARDAARALLQAEQELKQGVSMFIYPEGTTQKPAGALLADFKEGAFYLAVRNQTPIVPVAIIGSSRAMAADGKFLIRPALIQVRVLPPIATAGLGPADVPALTARVRNAILSELAAA
jgi:1-acyl-sn-glycerol-3-phosphate acyltransferase